MKKSKKIFLTLLASASVLAIAPALAMSCQKQNNYTLENLNKELSKLSDKISTYKNIFEDAEFSKKLQDYIKGQIDKDTETFTKPDQKDKLTEDLYNDILNNVYENVFKASVKNIYPFQAFMNYSDFIKDLGQNDKEISQKFVDIFDKNLISYTKDKKSAVFNLDKFFASSVESAKETFDLVEQLAKSISIKLIKSGDFVSNMFYYKDIPLYNINLDVNINGDKYSFDFPDWNDKNAEKKVDVSYDESNPIVAYDNLVYNQFSINKKLNRNIWFSIDSDYTTKDMFDNLVTYSNPLIDDEGDVEDSKDSSATSQPSANSTSTTATSQPSADSNATPATENSATSQPSANSTSATATENSATSQPSADPTATPATENTETNNQNPTDYTGNVLLGYKTRKEETVNGKVSQEPIIYTELSQIFKPADLKDNYIFKGVENMIFVKQDNSNLDSDKIKLGFFTILPYDLKINEMKDTYYKVFEMTFNDMKEYHDFVNYMDQEDDSVQLKEQFYVVNKDLAKKIIEKKNEQLKKYLDTTPKNESSADKNTANVQNGKENSNN